MTMLRYALFFIVLVGFTFGQMASCESGGVCNDNDFCTGTFTSPDVCEDGECIPGALVCPFYTKETVTNRNDETGELQVTNDDQWVYLVWKSTNNFNPSFVYLYVAADPLQSDDKTTFPFQFSVESTGIFQVRVSLELLQNPTEMDPIYLALRLENAAGAGSWMSGYFTPAHHTHGGSYSYTSVCHCLGYSHVESLINRSLELETFSAYTAIDVPQQQEAEWLTNSSSTKTLSLPLSIISIILLLVVV